MHHGRRGLAADLAALLHVVTAEEAGKRTDVVVAALSGALARAGRRRRSSAATCASTARRQASRPLEEGDVLEFEIRRARAARSRAPKRSTLPIVYEDDELVVVDKPAGMVTHPAHGAPQRHARQRVARARLGHAARRRAAARARPPARPRHVRACWSSRKTTHALGARQRDESARIKREYLGLVRGVPRTPARHDRRPDRPRSAQPPEVRDLARRQAGRHALRGARRVPEARRARLPLETGRTHQIRVHSPRSGIRSSTIRVYGKTEPRFELPGQALHAWRLAFRASAHRREPLAFEAAPPAGVRRSARRCFVRD